MEIGIEKPEAALMVRLQDRIGGNGESCST